MFDETGLRLNECFTLKQISQLTQQMLKSRSSRLQMFFKIGFLKNFAIFTRKYSQYPQYCLARLQLY